MNFTRWMRFFQSRSDDLLLQLGLPAGRLNSFKTFRDDYLKAARAWGLRWMVPDEEIIQAWWVQFPDERPIGELTVAEARLALVK